VACASIDKQFLKPIAVGSANGDVGSIDPAHVTGVLEYDIARRIFPPLVTLDGNLKPIDWAAKSHEVSEDRLTWTFHLNKGMKWSDGNPIDSKTFAYSINRMLDPCTRSEVARYLFGIQGAAAFHAGACPAGAHTSAKTLVGSSIIAGDPMTLQIKLSAPDPSFLFALATPGAWAVPKQLISTDFGHWTERLADDDGFGGNLYKASKWDHAGHFEMAVNDSFWGKKPILPKILFTLYRDATVAVSDYKSGVGDMITAPIAPSDDLRNLKGTNYSAIPALDLTYLIPNWRLAPFDDLRMRQALALAVDRRALLHDAARETDLPTIHIVPAGLSQYTADLRDSADRTGDAALTSAPEKAVALAQSYANANCGGALSACSPITLTYADAPDQQTLAQALLAQWRRILPGLQFSVRAVAPATLDQSARLSQLTLTTWRADLPDTLAMLLSRLRTGGAQNLGAASVPDADTLLDQAATISTGSGEVSLDQISHAEQLYATNVAWIPLAQGTFAQAMRSNVIGLTYGADQHISLTTWQTAYIRA
jgi:peptide/nickel transport system substrate-binding protein/oligopeptide transport system substrate-binding protein